LGLTKYKATGNADTNIVFNDGSGNHDYCAGCNGSFELDFTAASLGGPAGIQAAGFDFANFPLAGGPSPSFSFVTFADSSTASFSLATTSCCIPLDHSFGITSTVGITMIHLGLADGGSTVTGGFAIDNLSVGAAAVPEPSTLVMLFTGLGGLTLIVWRK